MLELSQCVLNVCHSPEKHIYLPWWVCAEQPPLSFSQSEPSVLWWCIWGNPPLKVSTDTKRNGRPSILSLVPRGKAITGRKMISPVSFWWFSRLDSKLLLLCDTWVEWKTGKIKKNYIDQKTLQKKITVCCHHICSAANLILINALE